MSDTPTAPTTLDPHVLRYLEHVRVEKRLGGRPPPPSPPGPDKLRPVWGGGRGFFSGAGRQGLIPHTPVQAVRAPKAPKPLPKALGVDDAVRLAEFDNTGADPWLEARDAAMAELLYGCGLRVR